MNSSSSILIHDVKKQRKTINSYIQLEKAFANTKPHNPLTRKGAIKDPTNLAPQKNYIYNTPGNEYIDFLNNPYDRPSHCDSVPVRFSISTKSLDYVIGTFRATNHDNNTNDTNKVVLSSTSRPFSGAFGEDKCTFDNQVRSGKPVLFNNSKYLVRNGESLTEATWFVGNTRLLTEKPTEIFDGVLRHFNIQNDVLGGLHPSIKCLQQFNKYSFAHILSLNVSGESDMYTVSGLDSEETPVNVGWEFKSNADFPDDDTWGLVEAGQNCIPTLIACYSSHIEIKAQRNIISVN